MLELCHFGDAVVLVVVVMGRENPWIEPTKPKHTQNSSKRSILGIIVLVIFKGGRQTKMEWKYHAKSLGALPLSMPMAEKKICENDPQQQRRRR